MEITQLPVLVSALDWDVSAGLTRERMPVHRQHSRNTPDHITDDVNRRFTAQQTVKIETASVSDCRAENPNLHPVHRE